MHIYLYIYLAQCPVIYYRSQKKIVTEASVLLSRFKKKNNKNVKKCLGLPDTGYSAGVSGKLYQKFLEFQL